MGRRSGARKVIVGRAVRPGGANPRGAVAARPLRARLSAARAARPGGEDGVREAAS